MPKSKRKKTRYTRKAKTSQPVTTGAQSVTSSTPVIRTQPAVVAPATRTGPATSRSAPAFQLAHVGTELKVIGIITAIILVAIIMLYFILR
jgi:hypothetical protein